MDKRLEYKRIGWPEGNHFEWKLILGEECIIGTANSVRQVYRKAKKALKQYSKMQKLFNSDGS